MNIICIFNERVQVPGRKRKLAIVKKNYRFATHSGQVRRRHKKRPTNPAEDSDSDTMETDPEAGSQCLTSEGQGSDDQASVETQSLTDVKETTKLKEKEDDEAAPTVSRMCEPV